MKECFIEKNFGPEALRIIQYANDVIDGMQAQGYDLSLRQLYYQYVAAKMFPEDRTWSQIPGTKKWYRDPNGSRNAEPNYKWLGDIISDARLAGLVDWDVIEDREREVDRNSHWGTPKEILEICASQFRLDSWADQSNYVMVMVEKKALAGVLSPVCRRLDVPFSANKGYASLSHLYNIGKDMKQRISEGQDCHVVYLGDHDPSGMDMSRDVEDRLSMFAGSCVEVHRAALNMDQIKELDLPPDPTKLSDSRAKKYVEEFGETCWELDALPVAQLVDIVENAVNELTDVGPMDDVLDKQQGFRDELLEVAKKYALP